MLLVTALYDIEGGSLEFGSYLELLGQLLSSGVPFWVYCDPARRAEVAARVPAGADVVVMGIPLSEFRTHAAIMAARPAVPESAHPAKDTLPFLALVNTKLEFVHRAALMKPDVQALGFIDAGITRLFRDPTLARRRLQVLHRSTLEGVLFPGIHEPRPTGSVSATGVVNWRFCGGFFAGQRDRLSVLYAECDHIVQELLSIGRVTWEVNVWALAEFRGASFGWYAADHDDRLLAWPDAPGPQSY